MKDFKIKLYWYVGIGIIIVVLVSVFAGGKALREEHTITLGYCPTMELHARELALQNKAVTLVRYGDSARALHSLSQGLVDVIMIGRLAKSDEITDDAHELMLTSGYTLVSYQKQFVEENALSMMRIHSAAPREVIDKYLPSVDVVVYQTTSEAIEQGLSEAVLISWDDFIDEYELLVVVNDDLKVERFRVPVLYSYDEELLRSIRI